MNEEYLKLIASRIWWACLWLFIICLNTCGGAPK